ncbi:MAG: tRNA pseudouridine(13) synthase TruD [Methylococcales bacterium]|nr:tRNA pseudouridine(13) synthase TruD [Methylococcales bacterium]
MSHIELPVWATVYGSPSGQGKIRTVADDFMVVEHLAFEPSGEGEHVFLFIEKTGENTDYVARQLAKFTSVRQRDVSYAGLKDRHAVTSQWFSVWLAGKPTPDFTEFETESIKILHTVRHARKLKRGVLSGNSFKLLIRVWQGDKDKTEQQLNAIKAGGIANYYGEQRFGHAGHNVSKALGLFQGAKVGREQRSIYLSAARSYLFNHILHQRVLNKTWNQAMAGDSYVFDGSHSYFKADAVDDRIIQRLAAKEIHPTGLLWGKGNAELLPIEQAMLADNQELADGLIASGLEQDRRALRINVADLDWQFMDETTLSLSFTLPAGSYATAVLREIINLN